jgi:hypothetical protein
MTIQPTAIWRVRPGGSNTNGGGYDAGLSTPGTDRSQQDAAFVTFNGTTVRATTAGITNIITLVGVTGSSADIANVVNITGGTNFITGWYFITAAAASTWTLDRTCTTGAGAAMTGAMGGAWRDFWTNATTTAAALVPGNIIYILGTAVPNPASYVYDYTAASSNSIVNGNLSTNGFIYFLNDPATPGYKAPPDTTGGMPTVQINTSAFMKAMASIQFRGIWVVSGTLTAGQVMFQNTINAAPNVYIGCVIDQLGDDIYFNGDGAVQCLGCEFFSSAAGTPNVANSVVYIGSGPGAVQWCNIHDCVSSAVIVNAASGDYEIHDNIIAKNGKRGLDVLTGFVSVVNNIFDGNGGSAIVDETGGGSGLVVANNIISNHTTASTYGVELQTGTATTNERLRKYIDWNVFYNNTTNYLNLSAGPNDTVLASDPYVAQSTEDYRLK